CICVTCSSLSWGCPLVRSTVSECSVLIECGEANQQGANEPEGVNIEGTRVIGTERGEVGIGHVSADNSEQARCAKEQEGMQDAFNKVPDDQHNGQDEQDIPEGIGEHVNKPGHGDIMSLALWQNYRVNKKIPVDSQDTESCNEG